MKLIENKDSDVNLISSLSHDYVQVNHETLTQSCIISNKSIVTDLQLSEISQLNQEHINHLVSSRPEIIIFGSGNEHSFPDVSLLHPVAEKEIGFEVMNNKSAARTFNILVAEDRNVACLLIIHQP